MWTYIRGPGQSVALAVVPRDQQRTAAFLSGNFAGSAAFEFA